MERLRLAVQESTRREWLLQEARFELARVMRVGDQGRFTGTVVGSYRLGAVIGRGGMGEVYEANHVEDNSPAAVKTLRLDMLASPESVERFFRELRTVQRLESPHLVRVLEVARDTETIPFLAMERLRGPSLADLLADDERLSVKDASVLAREVAAGLTAAHAAGVVHRDLKPHNLIRHIEGANAIWKLFDFGIAKPAGDEHLTADGHAIGTPSYMAPEQARGQPVDARADIYGLGAVLYRALTGAPPFAAPDLAAALHAITHDRPPRPGRFTPLPSDIDRVLAIAMARRPADRFATATALAQAFTAAASGALPAELRRRAGALDTFDDAPPA